MKKEKQPLIGIIGGKGKMGNWFKIFFENQGLKVIISDKKPHFLIRKLPKKQTLSLSQRLSISPAR